jgi:hypothetical protein
MCYREPALDEGGMKVVKGEWREERMRENSYRERRNQLMGHIALVYIGIVVDSENDDRRGDDRTKRASENAFDAHSPNTEICTTR